jgi:hypothetical protein
MSLLYHYKNKLTCLCIQGPHNGITGDVEGIHGECSDITGDVTGITGDVTFARGDVTGLTGDIASVSLLDATGFFGELSNEWLQYVDVEAT